jgi:adenylate cyclase
MPPTFQDEGIEAAREVRRRLPGTGTVVLSQYDDPEYAVRLLGDGAAGYAYILKDRVSDAGLLGWAIGGRLRVESAPGAGTTISGEISI